MTVSIGDGVSAVNPTTSLADPLKYKKWRVAAGRVRDGSANAKILLIGDSTTNGSGAGGAGYTANGRVKNRSVKLAAGLTRSYLPANAHGQVGGSNVAPATYQSFDPRWNYGAGWATQTVLNKALGRTSLLNNSTTNAVTFTPAGNVDTFVVYYAQAASQGTFNYLVDGAGSTLVTATNATPGVGSVTIAAGSPGTHTLSIIRNISTIHILGIRAFDSTNPSIEIIQAGCSGAIASDYDGSTNPWDGLNFIQNNIQPDLSIFCMGINDWAASTSLAAFSSSVRNILTACLVTGDALLVTPFPSQISFASLATQQQYVDAAIAVARSLNVEHVDVWRRIVSYETGQPQGYFADTQHPSGVGYSDWTQAEINKIISI